MERKTFESYIETALWASDLDMMCIGDLHPETRAKLKDELARFCAENVHLLHADDTNKSMEYFAHNLWLTQNGHGAGFWDGGYANGDKLTTACEKLGARDLYVGSDGLIYV